MTFRRVGQRLAGALGLYLVLCWVYAAVLDSSVTPDLRASILEASATAVAGLSEAELGPGGRGEARRRWIAAQEAAWGLDQPWVLRAGVRALHWAVFDFGPTRLGEPQDPRPLAASVLVLRALGQTGVLFGLAAVFTGVLGLGLGIAAARRPSGFLSRSLFVWGPLARGAPAWWWGLLVITLTFWVAPAWTDRGALGPPLVLLVVLGIPSLALVVRSLLVGDLDLDFVTAARARGLTEARVVFGHWVRSRAGALVQVGGQGLVTAFGGDLLVEIVFRRPGLGLLFWQALGQRDLGTAGACLVAVSAVVCLAYAGLDLINEALDPRVTPAGPRGRRRFA